MWKFAEGLGMAMQIIYNLGRMAWYAVIDDPFRRYAAIAIVVVAVMLNFPWAAVSDYMMYGSVRHF